MGSVPSPLSAAECQRMMADELAVGSPSKEEELLQLMSVAFGESRLGRQGGLPKTWGSSLGVLQGLGEQEASLQPWHPLVELLQKERPAQLSRLCSGALIHPGRVGLGGFSEADAEEVKP